ncbi:MAG: HypC/HybG/HupF family hydrogenase formation chaperone [Candidatus Nephrothrix sp. EaCA]|nr:MAG: HypC/HybG/HupF family hydrogenase formation chaperone [Candidatus Nephrothrix sp. EaCA]
MCLAVPGKIQSVKYLFDGKVKMARVSFGGVVKEASLEIVPSADVGDYVLIHAGVAISKVNEEEADKVFGYLKEAGELDDLCDAE